MSYSDEEEIRITSLSEDDEFWDDFLCLDCKVSTLFTNEYYMVNDSLWTAANPLDNGMLCVSCLEGRIGRELHSGDFIDAPVNFMGPFSELLTLRFKSPVPAKEFG